MKKIVSFCFVLSMTGIATPAVVADGDTGVYFGVSMNRLSADQKDVNDVHFDDSDNAFGAKIGYMFNNKFGLEGGYMDLGNYQTKSNNRGVDLNLDVDAFYAAFVLNYDISDNFAVYGKLGAAVVDSNSDFTDFDESSTQAFGGVGIEYDFGSWNLFGELSKVDTDVNDLTVDVLSVGVKWEMR